MGAGRGRLPRPGCRERQKQVLKGGGVGTPPKSRMPCPHFSWKPPPAGQTNIFSKALKPVTHWLQRPLAVLGPPAALPTPPGLIAPSGAVPAPPGQRRWQAPGSAAAAPPSPPWPGLRPTPLSPQVHAAPQELRPDRIVPGEEGESRGRPAPPPVASTPGAANRAGRRAPHPPMGLLRRAPCSAACLSVLPSCFPPGSAATGPAHTSQAHGAELGPGSPGELAPRMRGRPRPGLLGPGSGRPGVPIKVYGPEWRSPGGGPRGFPQPSDTPCVRADT